MLKKLLKFLLSESDSTAKGYISPFHYEDGLYVDGKVSKMTDAELMLPAEKARVLSVESVGEVRLKARRKVFQQIHTAIKQGKTKVRLESHHVKPETLEYFEGIGYTISRVTPPAGSFDNGPVFDRDDDGEDIPGTEHPYFYYSLTWGDSTPAAVEGTEATVAN